MAFAPPADFDVRDQVLDGNESFIRDALRVDLDGWARFRYAINIGNSAECLHARKPIKESVQEAYRELAKSHYEVVTSLGSARLSLNALFELPWVHPLIAKKSVKELYFSFGCVLDNLARLVYIVNDPRSANEKYTSGWRKGLLRRHWIGWGELSRCNYRGYVAYARRVQLRQVINIRNHLTHQWGCPIIHDRQGMPYWPLAARTQRVFLWPFDEEDEMRQRYRKWIPVTSMTKSDFEFVERLQNDVFRRLTKDIRRFERNYGLVIGEPKLV